MAAFPFSRIDRRTVIRVIVALAIVVPFGLGLLGLKQYYESASGQGKPHSFLKLLYYDLQLYKLDSPFFTGDGRSPIMLIVASIAAPLSAVFFFGVAVNEIRRIKNQYRRGHAIVAGDSTVARAIAGRIPRTKLYRIPTASDATDPKTFREAGINGARAVYACADDRADHTANVAIALAAVTARPVGRRPRIYAHVSDGGLALALRARRLGLRSAKSHHLDFFNIDETATRVLIHTTLGLDPTSRPHILIIGAGGFGRAVLVEYANRWRLQHGSSGERFSATIVDTNASISVAETRRRWRVVDEACTLTLVDGEIESALASGQIAQPDQVFVCQDDEELALRTALTATRLWQGGVDSIVVRLNHLGVFGAAFRRHSQHDLLDNLKGRLRFVGVTELGSDPIVIDEDLVDRLAQAIHEYYLLESARLSSQPANPSMVPWSALSSDKRSVSRSLAEDIATKLDLINCTAAPHSGEPFDFSLPEVEVLAEKEHERWCKERTEAGWVFAEHRNDERKEHPSLVVWAELPNEDRDKTRDAIRTLPAVLASAGLQIVRFSIR